MTRTEPLLSFWYGSPDLPKAGAGFLKIPTERHTHYYFPFVRVPITGRDEWCFADVDGVMQRTWRPVRELRIW